MKVFSPDRLNRLPRRLASVVAFIVFDPAPGSVIAKQNWISPRQAAGSSSFLWNSLPWLAIWASDMVGPTTIIKSGMP